MDRRKLILVAGAVLLAVTTLALRCGEDPPTVPEITLPTVPVYQGADVPVRFVSTQPQDRSVQYIVEWGDGVTDTSALDYPSGVTATLTHAWADPGAYEIRAMALVHETPDLVSDWSDPVTLTIEANSPPEDVRLTRWPLQTARGRWARFEAVAEDPEGDSVQYQFEYAGRPGSWTTPLVPSGSPGLDSHRFTSLGTFEVRVRARDHKGTVSGWSPPESVVVDTTGVVTWAWITPDEDEGPAIGSALLLMVGEEERVYVGAEDEAGRFYAIRVRDGRRATSSSGMDEDWFSGHPAYVAATGNIVVGNENGELYAFAPGNLARRWNWPNDRWPLYMEWGVPAINGNRIYATRDRSRRDPSVDSIYYLTDLGASVRYERAYAVPGIKSNPVITTAGHVAVVTDSGRFLVLDGNTLAPVWDTVLTTGNVALNVPVAGAAGHLYVGDAAGNVYCIRPDFSVDWTVQVIGEVGGMVVGDGALYVATGASRLFKLNAQTGATIWNITLVEENDVEVTPILTANGLIYVQDDMDILHCIRQADGSYVWWIELDEYAPLMARGRRRGQRDFENPFPYSPGLASNGDIIVVGMDALYCIAGYTEGTLAPTPWPKWQGSMHNTGRAAPGF